MKPIIDMSNAELRDLHYSYGYRNGGSIYMQEKKAALAKKYGYEHYSDIPTKKMTFLEFCECELLPKTPYNPYGYDVVVAKMDYEEMIAWE